jgi:hypothetical protein
MASLTSLQKLADEKDTPPEIRQALLSTIAVTRKAMEDRAAWQAELAEEEEPADHAPVAHSGPASLGPGGSRSSAAQVRQPATADAQRSVTVS